MNNEQQIELRNDAKLLTCLFASMILGLSGIGYLLYAFFLCLTTDAGILNDYWQTSVCLLVLADWALEVYRKEKYGTVTH